jgi:hypothetical protein
MSHLASDDTLPSEPRIRRRLAWVRLVLGFAQMGGAVLSATFMATLGLGHPWSIAAVLSTTALTATSIALFQRASR